jgi:hypothetical protein
MKRIANSKVAVFGFTRKEFELHVKAENWVMLHKQATNDSHLQITGLRRKQTAKCFVQ